MSDILLTVQDEETLELKYVEAKIKPEQTKSVVPTYEQQIVLPDSGMTLGQVNVDAIPEPTERMDITANGEHHVERFGVVDVNVQPTLQQKSVTPTKSQQAVEADENFYGLNRVVVEQIPDEYIVPSGKFVATENATNVDIRQFATADIAVPTERTPVLIDTIDIADFAEPVNRVNIDMSQYTFDGFNIIYIDIDNVQMDAADWMYFSCGGVSGAYFDGNTITHNCKKVFFVKIEQDKWRNVVKGGGAYPNTGDRYDISNIAFYCYKNTTKYVGGKLKIYAL